MGALQDHLTVTSTIKFVAGQSGSSIDRTNFFAYDSGLSSTGGTTTTRGIADAALSQHGLVSVEWAESRMPVLVALQNRYAPAKPLKGHRISCCVHVTKETAVLIKTLLAAGAEIACTGGNQLSTQDDVAAYLAELGVKVFAWRGMSSEEMNWGIERALNSFDSPPTLIVDDGGDMISLVHAKFPEFISQIIGGTDKTTSGVYRVRSLASKNRLGFPIIAVNNALTKLEVDNTYGTGQSTIDGIVRATSLLLAGKTFVVGGYGHVGRGVALRAKGMGAQVVVTCIHATTALKAIFEGFRVMPMTQAAKIGDVFCTTTGVKDVIVGSHLDEMKDGAILCNAGHSNCEIDLQALEARTEAKSELRPYVTEHVLQDGRRLFLLAQGGLINLGAAEGNPSEVMDMTFANQFLALLKLAKEGGTLSKEVYDLPDAQDQEVAALKLQTMGVCIDALTADQQIYLTDYGKGT